MYHNTQNALRELDDKKYQILDELQRFRNHVFAELSGVDKHTLHKLRDIINRNGELETRIIQKVNTIESRVTAFITQYEKGYFETIEDFRSAVNDIISETLNDKYLRSIVDASVSETLDDKVPSISYNSNNRAIVVEKE